jgi:hypothetical protein
VRQLKKKAKDRLKIMGRAHSTRIGSTRYLLLKDLSQGSSSSRAWEGHNLFHVVPKVDRRKIRNLEVMKFSGKESLFCSLSNFHPHEITNKKLQRHVGGLGLELVYAFAVSLSADDRMDEDLSELDGS